MSAIEPGNLVIIYCMNPKEKLWGELRRLDAVGVTLRGLELYSVEDWLRQERGGSDDGITPSTVFIPMHRVERIYADESNATVECFADRYAAMCGGDVRKALARSHSAPKPDSDISAEANR